MDNDKVVSKSISMRISIWDGSKKAAESDRRSVSAYIEGLVERDLRRAGIDIAVPSQDPEEVLRSEVMGAVEKVGLAKALSILVRADRPQRKSAYAK